MALRLSSTDLSTRVDGYQTIGGAAMGYFMKIRSERNMMIWKQKIKDANPAARIKHEQHVLDSIVKLEESRAKMARQDSKARMKFLLEDRKERGKNFRAVLASSTKLRTKESEIFGKVLDEIVAEGEASEGVEARGILQGGLGIAQQTANELISQKEANRAQPGTHSSAAIRELENSLFQQFRSAVDDGAQAAEKEKNGEYALDHFYRLAHRQAQKFMEGSEANPEDIAQIRDLMIVGVNDAKFPGQGRQRDVWIDFLNKRDLDSELLKQQQKFLSGASAAGINVKEVSADELDKLFGTSTAKMDTRIDTLYGRLDELKVERKQKQAEYEHLLRGGGMHMGIDPFSYRPSRVGSRMEAMQRMYEAEPSLEAATERSGDVTYGTGTGGNLSDFLKARIGEYREMGTTGADPTQIMNKFVKAVDLYGDTVQDADVTFDVPVTIRGQKMANIKDVLASYKANKEHIAKGSKDPDDLLDKNKKLADYYLQELSGDTNLTRDYGGPQRVAELEEDPEGVRVEEYHSRLYPARSNVSVVLNPYIEKIMDARSAGDKEGIYNSMRDLQNVVEDPDLDDLLGSAGTNIRGALGDLHSSAEQIGADAALERTSRHVLKQYQDLAGQRVEQDPGRFVEGLEG